MLSLFDGNIVRPVGQHYGNDNSVRLVEHDASASLKELVVTHLPPRSLVCDFDPVQSQNPKKKFSRYSWFFRVGNALACKQCDGGIYLPYGGAEYFLIVELKSSTSGLADGRKQVEAGKAFARYVEAVYGRQLVVLTRIIYLGAPKPAGTMAKSLTFPQHMEIGTVAKSGRVFLAMSELVG